MTPVLRSFSVFIRQILRDNMLFAVCAAPLLAAVVFRFCVPAAESLLCAQLGQAAVLKGYYLLFDLCLCVITPYLFCFASAMVMLTEYDENMTAYMAVTPVGKRGYITSRLVLPAAISFFASALLLAGFSLTAWQPLTMLTACLLSGLMSVALALMLFAFSHNRVEGMAMAKLSGLVLLGLPVPFFLTSGLQYLFAPLPSFWLAKLCVTQSGWFLLPGLGTSLIWIAVLYKRFERKFG